MKQLVSELDEEKKIRLSLQVSRNLYVLLWNYFPMQIKSLFIWSTKSPLSVTYNR